MKLFKSRLAEPGEDADSQVEGERALSPINRGITLQNRVTSWAIMAGACALAAVLLYKYYAGVYESYRQTKELPKDVTRTAATTALPPLVVPSPEPEPSRTPMKAADPLPPLTPQASPIVPAGTAAQPPVKSLAEAVRERRLKRQLRFSIGNDHPAEAGDHIPAAGHLAVNAVVGKPDAQGSVMQVAAKGGRAYMLADPTLMIPQGKVLPCNVMPAIDTTLTGNVTCIVDEDVRGADNKVVLMNRGTQCFGKQGTGVVLGQRRVGIIWTRCETDEHVLVPLDSPAADALGRPGVPGQVDNHFWDRFGAAIALSLISDVGPYLVATRQGNGSNNTTVAFPSMSTGPQQVMTEVLKSTLDIPPTLSAPQGSRVLIYLAGDLDFRDVYTLRRTR
jgi:type IV secretion system protein VirB10